MYILELLYKLFNKEKKQLIRQEYHFDGSEDSESYDEKCEHIFLPIDSTKKILACSKCGYILKVTDQKKKNFFLK